MKILRTDPDRFGIRARLLTLLLPAILGLLALDSWNDYRALRNQVQDAYDQSMLEAAHALQSSVAPAQDGSLQLNAPAGVQALFATAGPLQKYLHVGLINHGETQAGRTEATLLGATDLPGPPPPYPDPYSPDGVRPVWYDDFYAGHPVRVVALRSQVLDGQGRPFSLLVQVAESTVPRDRAQDATLRQELIRDARMVLVMVLLVWLGVTWSLQPLERLRKSVLQGKGDELKPLDTSGVPHEVAPLVEALNQHLASYRELLEQQSQFLADASHQLRTPLAIMLTQAGVALREKDTGQIHTTLRAMVAQIARSRRLCEQLLSLAHANESAPPAGMPTLVDLNAVAREVVLQHLALAHEKNLDLGWVDARGDSADTAAADDAPAPAVPVLAREPELHEALSNLVHNAIVYTPPGGQITVMAGNRDGMALAEVRDSGPGIAQARRAEVFERFHSAGSVAEKGSHGAGLGLSIARAYARRNGGDIELADGPTGTGLRAILRLPLAAVPQR
ncbi:signal transduction histidine kinase [Polaromonas sp. CF318]|uniref:sensor histidine kinase n=1 Tax=Polaromonas sp. CF318 TaxID=1144318 RepID=UPI000271262C|nr:sensor histidine kinase [Polaromonas sp. CF318]EJL90100.1 signal transduction histidine kinase [Polaromonas sp. CF318]